MELIRNTSVSYLGFTHVPFCPHNMVAMLGSLVSPFFAHQLTHIARLNRSVGGSLFKFSRIFAVFPVEASFPLTWDPGLWILQNLRLLGKYVPSAIPLFDFQIHISHSSGDWESRIMVPAWSGSDESLSLIAGSDFFLWSHMAEWVCSLPPYKGMNPIPSCGLCVHDLIHT